MPSVKVFIEEKNETKKVDAHSVEELLEKLKINPEVVLVVKNNELVTKKSKIKKSDEIKLLAVISSG